MLEKMVTVCFKLPEREYKLVRIHAAREGLSMQEVLTQMLQTWMDVVNVKIEEKD